MTISELVADLENKLVRNREKYESLKSEGQGIVDRAKRENRDFNSREVTVFDGVKVDLEKCVAASKRIAMQLESAREAQSEESDMDNRLRNATRPEGLPDRDNPAMLMGVGSGNTQAVSGPQWRGVSASGGGVMPSGEFNAAIQRDQAWGDHPVNKAHAERVAEQDRIISGTHGNFAQQIRAITTSGASAIVPTVWADSIIDRARNKSVTMQAGVTLVPMPAKVYQVGRLNTDPSAAFKTEGSTITASDPAFDFVQLTATTLTALTVVSTEFLQDAVNADSVIQDAIAQVMALEIDKTVLYGGFLTGDGVAGEGYNLATPYPTNGIFKNLLTNAVANVLNNGTTNGTVQTGTSWFRELQSLYFSVKKRNETPGALIMNDGMLQRYVDAYDTQGRVLDFPANIREASILTTNAVPNVTKGTGTLMSNVFCADWSQVLLGQRQGMEIRVLGERYAENNQVGIVATWRGDVNLARLSAAGMYRYLQGS